MTENEALNMLKAKLKCTELEDLACIEKGCDRQCENCDLNYEQGNRGQQKEAMEVAIKSLEEIQQYRAIGTVEECREARERQREKKYKIIEPCKSVTYYQCPCCDGLLHINENFCGECGQAIDWSDAD